MLDIVLVSLGVYALLGLAMFVGGVTRDVAYRQMEPLHEYIVHFFVCLLAWPVLLLEIFVPGATDTLSSVTFSLSVMPFSWRLQVGGPWSGASALWIVVGPIDIGMHWSG